ncbi:hypothetical protein ACFFGT_20380 [Mucilaginibacter angelicae]|uniref:Uncharacterized protein n=1 Tax=Mucilaginibacter angelicae TaxID=869718 RepID=A0ABV6LAR8_9SPHI
MIKKTLSITLVFMAAYLSCFAQLEDPCVPVDNDSFCPLDTWVIVLAVAAFAFTAIHLYRKQKAIQA